MRKALNITFFFVSQLIFLVGMGFITYIAMELNATGGFVEYYYTFFNYWIWLIIGLILIGGAIALSIIFRINQFAIIERDILYILVTSIALSLRIIETYIPPISEPTPYLVIGYVLLITLLVCSLVSLGVDIGLLVRKKVFREKS